MSRIAITSNASGTSTFTVASPISTTDRVLLLPDASGNVVLDSATQSLSNKTLNSPTLTGTITLSNGAVFSGSVVINNVTFTGTVTLPGDPTANLHAATKQYVDVNDSRLRRSGSAVISTTSGTAHDVIGIPDWANMIEILFRGVSLSGTDRILVQLGTPSGFVTSGYMSGTGWRISENVSNAGFIVFMGYSNNDASFGILRIIRYNNNIWVSEHVTIFNFLGSSGTGAGVVDLGGVLDRIRVTRTGTNTFDAGEFIVKWSSQ